MSGHESLFAAAGSGNDSVTPETELASLRKLYGAKFTAITAALGHACAAQEALQNDDTEAAGAALDKVVSILADA